MDRLSRNPSAAIALSSLDLQQPETSSPTHLSPGEIPLRSSSHNVPPFNSLAPNTRKKTLIALIDELTLLSDEDYHKENDITYGPTVGGHPSSETEGVERFRIFDRRIRSLDLKLQSFTNAIRELGSSVGLLNATYNLHTRLTKIQYLFRKNAANQFNEIDHDPSFGSGSRKSKARKSKTMIPNMRPATVWPSEVEDLPVEMRGLASDLKEFLKRLHDVAEFSDKSVNVSIMDAVNASVKAFKKDLKYHVSSLEEFKGQLKSKAVARYINDLTDDLGVHMDDIKVSLDVFIDFGVPTIRFSQKHTATGLQNLSTVATFFSGVTATTLQFSYEGHGAPMSDLLNALWLSSLVFSIACAINSQLAYHCGVMFVKSSTPADDIIPGRAAHYHSPRSYVPWWVAIWITSTPLFFLVGSVVTFLIGLCLFTYSSQQSPVVSAVITVFTTTTSSALLSVGLWFASERWIYAHTDGKKWLLDVLKEHAEKAAKFTGIAPARCRVIAGIKNILTFARAIKCWMIAAGKRVMDISGHIAKAVRSFTQVLHRLILRMVDMLLNRKDLLNRNEDRDEESQGSTKSCNDEPATRIEATDTKEVGTITANNARFRAVTRRVMSALKISTLANLMPRTTESAPSLTVPPESQRRRNSPEQIDPAQLQELAPLLKRLWSNQTLNKHVALVKHLQFSPDGQFLATCSWDKSALIWKVESGPSDKFKVVHKLFHLSRIGGFVSQVAWNPTTGDQLLTKQAQSIKIWDAKTGDCKKTIERERNVRSIAWLPKGSSFLSIEWRLESKEPEAKKYSNHTEDVQGSVLVILDIDGTVQDDHHLERLKVWDAAVMPEQDRIVAVATLVKSTSQLKPVKSRNEKRIMIYNLKTKEIEDQIPLLQEVRDVTLTAKGTYALISYENKAPPQAWQIYMDDQEQRYRLTLTHTYITKHPVDFAGPSYFGGSNDTFVLCASKDGWIYIWERTSGILLHSLNALNQDLTNIAWNNNSPGGLMFASAAYDGTVRIWTTATTPPPLLRISAPPSGPEIESSIPA